MLFQKLEEKKKKSEPPKYFRKSTTNPYECEAGEGDCGTDM